MNFHRFVVYISLFFISLSTYSQSASETGNIKGSIKESITKDALFNVVVSSLDNQVWCLSDSQGSFILKNLSPGNYKLTFQRIGLATKTIDLTLKSGENLDLNVVMEMQSLSLDEVVIIAKENPNKLSSSSLIGIQAIEHIQANSLGDILQLIPGQLLQNPDLNNSNAANIRLASTDANNEKINSFGTTVILDGAPISNNANLQVTNTASIGAEGYFETNSGGGVDLREMTPDNIESVEVIRGIPSVRYGDLSSGAIIVNTKAGKTPFIGKVRSNPNTNQFFLGKGFFLGEKRGHFNVDVDYTNSKADIRKSYPSYNRYSANLTYSNVLFDNKWMTTTKIKGLITEDQDFYDIDAASEECRYSNDQGIRITSNGSVRLDKKWSRNIKYNLTAHYKNQESYTKKLNSGSITMLSTHTTEGIYEVPFIPSEYYSETSILGKPLNLFASVENKFHFEFGKFKNRISIGSNWKTDVNFGLGRMVTFDETNSIFPSSSLRPRPYKDIPALNQFSVFLEDEISKEIFSRLFQLQIGLRYDNIQPLGLFKGEFGTTLLPRLNMKYHVSDAIKIRAAYGKSSKAPALIYLYPDVAYFDMQSYQYYYADNPELSRAFISTKILQIDNSNIRSSINEKIELGLNLSFAKNTLNITAYSENLKGGHAFIDQFTSFEYEIYKLLYFNALDGIHLVDTVNTLSAIARNVSKVPTNTREIKSRGLELDFNSVKIKATGTSFNLAMAWFKSETKDAASEVYMGSQYFYENDNALIGLYNNNGKENERLISTLRIIQHIPKLSLIASLSLQTKWIDSYRAIINNEIPLGYYDTQGNFSELSASEIESGDFDFLIREFDDNIYLEVKRPPLFLFSFKLSKEFQNNLLLSFYANNALMHNPVYYNNQTGTSEVLNPELFFGAELNVKFKL